MCNLCSVLPTNESFILGQLILLGVYLLPWVVYFTTRPAKRARNRIFLVYNWWLIILLSSSAFIVYQQSDHLPRFLESRTIVREAHECGHRLVVIGCHMSLSPERERHCIPLAMCVTRPLEDLSFKAFLLSFWDLLTNCWFAFPQITFFVASVIATIITIWKLLFRIISAPELSVFDNIGYGDRLRGCRRDWIVKSSELVETNQYLFSHHAKYLIWGLLTSGNNMKARALI